MTNPLIHTLASIINQEANMDTDDTREGYADGMCGHIQLGRSRAYVEAVEAGEYDAAMLEFVAEWKRRGGVA